MPQRCARSNVERRNWRLRRLVEWSQLAIRRSESIRTASTVTAAQARQKEARASGRVTQACSPQLSQTSVSSSLNHASMSTFVGGMCATADPKYERMPRAGMGHSAYITERAVLKKRTAQLEKPGRRRRESAAGEHCALQAAAPWRVPSSR